MEMERMNMDTSGEEEEKENIERNSRVCTSCDKIHESISKWMLPENARGTYLERANCIPPPLFIISISLAELAVFIYYAVWKPQKQWITLDTGVWNSPFIYRPDKREETWRFISYMLVHAGIQHILGNLFLQLILGIPLEMVHKGHRVSLVYLAGVIGGSLASSVCDPLQALVGASGGVYALIGGYFMNVLVNFREMIPLFGVFRLLLIGIIVGTDMGFALYRRFIAPVNGPQVSFVAHIAGGLAGMSVGYVIFSCFDKNFIKDPRFWISIVAYLVFLVFAVFFNIFLSPAN
ncbi:rhomboid-related protein 2 [Malaclemys terrapin pileata]|uniref:rhomboid-related protein 2 n=1 Tax=Malaclemys terrapin pileata TaxID=2991368 RepID=UPI0023A7ACA0|nr:rhomboid-related protein 2 [Malaclemys terrapin pileata]XP_053867775.1 rhomboid-related protein 2 [Malaclemys terrapin pileata]XP_053867776.1 rhomboid-related protein 2 [Malaclemys terrapin pileata]XP_053867777.1 rhomboid-related protein 2 [Malaclemys terrapin pileata]XP_053867778.1 rhomboid-related protein 2 [Malaclemys terrapin pileata]